MLSTFCFETTVALQFIAIALIAWAVWTFIRAGYLALLAGGDREVRRQVVKLAIWGLLEVTVVLILLAVSSTLCPGGTGF